MKTTSVICCAALLLTVATGGSAEPDWLHLNVPGAWQEAGGKLASYHGMAWYRCFVKVPLGWKGDDLSLTVHKIDNCHEAYFNGVKVGSQGSFPPRYRNGLGDRPVSYTVPARQVRPGEYNLIAIRIYDEGGRGGFRGAAPVLANDAQAIALKGIWLFRTGDDRAWSTLARRASEGIATFTKVENAAAVFHRFFPEKISKGLTPAESFQRFTIPPDLALDQILTEPTVRQPVFLNFDERGRMWVVQYLQYPTPAGLKIVSRDVYWRNVYDKVPPPPPHHFRGKDKITIHEDTDGDGKFDKHMTFLDGLNIATAVERGRGGIWVLNPPYLLFYPDKNNDDIPDGAPVVHLEGFGLEDTHSVVNSLRWGPDGWLYGAQGSTVTGKVKIAERGAWSATAASAPRSTLPVYSMGQLIWRYHPEKRRYEVFAEGGGNAFGVEIDSKGHIFSGHNGGNTRGFHYVQGGYYQKGFSKHGPISNPYAFGYFPAMRHPNAPRFSHTFLKYEATALPSAYWGKLLAVSPMLSQVVESDIWPDGSSFQTKDRSFLMSTTDAWFRPVDIKIGPDGAVYVADWYDMQINHYRNHEGQIDPGSGRIYRLRTRGAAAIKPADLSRLSTPDLIKLLESDNRWTRQTALRLIADRRDASVIPRLKQLLAPSRESVPACSPQTALEALWALNLSGGFDDAFAAETLEHPDAYVRLWTVRLLADDNKVSPAIAAKLAARAQTEPHVEVRSQLACSARRLPARDCLPIVKALLSHDEDVRDIHIPLLLWWALESKADADRDGILGLFRDPALWRRPLVEQHILERLMRRYAQAGKRKDLLTCAELLNLAPTPDAARKLLNGFEQALAGRAPARFPDELVQALARHGGGSLALRLRQAESAAVEQALKIVADEKANANQRLLFVQILSDIKQPRSLPVLLRIVANTRNEPLRQAALAALLPFDDSAIGVSVVNLYPRLSSDSRSVALGLLASRKTWTRQLLQGVDGGTIDKSSVPLDVVRKMSVHRDPAIAELIQKHWGNVQGATTADMQKQIEHWQSVIASATGSPYAGKKLFNGTCAKCHTLFGQGGHIGPDLTAYKRDDLANMLLNIVNPSAEIREGYETHLVTTQDGRVLTGFLVDRDDRLVVLRSAEGTDISIPRKDIDETRVLRQSLMPEGLLGGMTEQQVRDLFAYLRSTQPLND